MEIEQSFTVAHAAARVWALLGDPHAVAGCLAGAEVTRVEADGALEGKMTVRFGPIQASFAGKGRLERDDDAMTGRIEGQGLDQRSRSQCKGMIDYSVAATEEGTEVRLKVDYTLAGPLAQFGRGGLVDDLARHLTQDFAEALEAALDVQSPDVEATAGEEGKCAPAAETAAAPSPPTAPPGEAFDAGGLFGAILWQRIKAWLARLMGRRS